MGLPDNQKLVFLFEQLSATDRATLLSFAEFLAQNASQTIPAVVEMSQAIPEPVPEPKTLPRPEEEKVVEAIKRLSQSYFMLNKREMLGVTSDLMTQHILHGKEAKEVIDQLEDIFREHYRQLTEGKD